LRVERKKRDGMDHNRAGGLRGPGAGVEGDVEMTDIANISLATLREDHAVSKLDLKLCEKLLLLMGPNDERREAYQFRVDGNREMIKVIEDEIDRRADESSREHD